jgi:iron complex transport system substrate-binding protein
MLTRLGHPVEVFQPAASLSDIRANLRQMGALLGREDAAETVIAQFDADLAALQDNGPRPRAALWFANGYAPGPATLAGQILDAAGYANIAVEAGISGTGFLSLEELVLLNPDVIVTGQSYPGSSRAEDIMRHPVVAVLNGTKAAPVTDRDWVCGTPRILRAVKSLRAARLASEVRG